MINSEKSVSLSEMLRVFLRRMWILIIVAVVVASATYAALAVTYTEEYTSKSTLFVMHPERGLSASSSTHYYEATINAVADCAELMTSRTVLYNIIDQLELDQEGMTYSKLKRQISIANIPDSHVIEVSVTYSDPDMAKSIVDLLCSMGAAQIESYIEFATAQVIDEGTLNRYPSNSVSLTLPILAGFGAALLLFGVFVLFAVYDDKIKDAADVESRLGLSVLGTVPYIEGKQRSGRSHTSEG